MLFAKNRALNSLLLAAFLFCSCGNGSESLDLRIKKNEDLPEGPVGHCALEPGTAPSGASGPPDSRLIVRVVNSGTRDIHSMTTTRVRFFWDRGEHSQDISTPGLAVGITFRLEYEFPPECFDPDCDFEILVDAEEEIAESDEDNNRTLGICLG